ncbi:MAG TPA: undecaprenyl-diphosphate phosphatase [Patescibacteria group bacterium]|nr:undecaprenyl-diphosphate phosphatase [Patescibacteria group bacterium]
MIWIAILLGLVEGITEFLPVSSTGHLILVGHLLGYTGEEASVFEIVIQLGAILAVVWEYRKHLFEVGTRVLTDRASFGLVRNLALAFVPAALVGFLFHHAIKERLFSPVTVACALVAGGIVMLAIEWARPSSSVSSIMEIPWTRALWVGLAQVLSLFPGVSRAAATILGGMTVGLDRRTATEFSFYLAIPTMLAATGYELLKSWSQLTTSALGYLAVGFVVAFLSALLAVRVFIRYVARHDLKPFAWYRIALGTVVLLYFARH